MQLLSTKKKKNHHFNKPLDVNFIHRGVFKLVLCSHTGR